MLLSVSRQYRHFFHRLQRSLPILRHITAVSIALTLLWLYVIHRGEHATFSSSIHDCDWKSWESWPKTAQPHRTVLIADPQLVDAHTYPGRPWPLSTLTERYTDRYMARSYRLINAILDPDSIVFLGDVFDGGREWAPQRARPLTKAQQWAMEQRSPATASVPVDYRKIDVIDPGWSRADSKAHSIPETHAEQTGSGTVLDSTDLTRFSHGEGARWKSYGNKYWEWEYNRFGKIFLDPAQLYPDAHRNLVPTSALEQELANLDNGAQSKTRLQYSLLGNKPRTVISSLPGNHDLGFGSGVQLSTRARFKWHFGELNRVDILGNHSFVSIDALSLAAWSQFEASGRESEGGEDSKRVAIYAQTQEFLDRISQTIAAHTNRTLQRLYPQALPTHPRWRQKAVNPEDDVELPQAEVKPTGTFSDLPVILLTHVPLYREPNTNCGRQRERGHALSITGGYQYQNVLTPTLSNTILQKLGRVAYIFSGDDHDYCDVTHTYDNGRQDVREETVKSFSWAMGVRRPGFMLLSMWNPIDETGKSSMPGRSMQTHLCLLPDQLGIFITYIQLAGITVAVLLVRALLGSWTKTANQNEDTPASPALELASLLPTSFAKLKKLANGHKQGGKHRQRASSTSLKPFSNGSLNVQRSANARARSVSPGAGFGAAFGHQQPLPSRPGHLTPPDHSRQHLFHLSRAQSEDEESRVGEMDHLDDDDSQAKWRRRWRPKGQARAVFDDFLFDLLLVASIAGTYYIVLIRKG